MTNMFCLTVVWYWCWWGRFGARRRTDCRNWCHSVRMWLTTEIFHLVWWTCAVTSQQVVRRLGKDHWSLEWLWCWRSSDRNFRWPVCSILYPLFIVITLKQKLIQIILGWCFTSNLRKELIMALESTRDKFHSYCTA